MADGERARSSRAAQLDDHGQDRWELFETVTREHPQRDRGPNPTDRSIRW